jgi:hypothetical protein
MGVMLHERGRPQDHGVEAAGGQRLLHRVLGAKEVDRVVGSRTEGRGVDETLDPAVRAAANSARCPASSTRSETQRPLPSMPCAAQSTRCTPVHARRAKRRR